VLFLEGFIRPLLVIHAVAAAVLVASTTHHVIWCRGYLRNEYGRHKGEKRFALIAASAFFCTFVLGNLLYPTYKVRVRAEYFDNPAAVADEQKLRDTQHEAVGAKIDGPSTIGAGLSPVARLFDIKEHWVALGCAASLLVLFLSRRAHPKDHPRVLPLYFGLAVIACSTAWIGAIVGLITASYRSVGGVS
jgi:hypothetical protein